MTAQTRILADNLRFTEGPRWRDGKLWFSDFFSYKVYTIDLEGKLETVVEVPNQPSGLGWLPSGELLVVSMIDRKVLQYDGEKLTEYADLSEFAGGHTNDMIVAIDGTAYVGNFGFDTATQEPTTANLIKIDRQRKVSIAAPEMQFPNGMVITDNNKTLIVAETFGKRLTAFTIDDDGNLSDRRTWASLGDYSPDGIAMDHKGAIWTAVPFSNSIIRVEKGGTITHTIPLQLDSYACAIGGENQEYLFICTAGSFISEECIQQSQSRIELLDLREIGAY